jgi:hypothetical protein
LRAQRLLAPLYGVAWGHRQRATVGAPRPGRCAGRPTREVGPC